LMSTSPSGLPGHLALPAAMIRSTRGVRAVWMRGYDVGMTQVNHRPAQDVNQGTHQSPGGGSTGNRQLPPRENRLAATGGFLYRCWCTGHQGPAPTKDDKRAQVSQPQCHGPKGRETTCHRLRYRAGLCPVATVGTRRRVGAALGLSAPAPRPRHTRLTQG
jgi:hypothetical protein